MCSYSVLPVWSPQPTVVRVCRTKYTENMQIVRKSLGSNPSKLTQEVFTGSWQSILPRKHQKQARRCVAKKTKRKRVTRSTQSLTFMMLYPLLRRNLFISVPKRRKSLLVWTNLLSLKAYRLKLPDFLPIRPGKTERKSKMKYPLQLQLRSVKCLRKVVIGCLTEGAVVSVYLKVRQGNVNYEKDIIYQLYVLNT